MIKGVIICKCGQLFGFETAQETVACPSCKMEHVAAQYEIIEPEIVEEALEGDE
jgi:predicted Zn-ribbon and HTH transcriptional regulator